MANILIFKLYISIACRSYSNHTARWYNEAGTYEFLIGSRIFDGSMAQAGEFPWMVQLMRGKNCFLTD